MSAPLISVIVVTYESGPVLSRCLEQLRSQTFRDFEVILADNGSRDRAAHLSAAEDPSLELLAFGENLGFAAANNRAARHAPGAVAGAAEPRRLRLIRLA